MNLTPVLSSCFLLLLGCLAPGRCEAAQQRGSDSLHLPVTPEPSGSGQRLLARVAIAGAGGAISPDGRQLVLESTESGPGLWLVDTESGGRRLLTPEPGTRAQAAWSPDGRYLAYIGATAYTVGGARVEGLWVVDAASGLERLAYVTQELWDLSTFRWTLGGALELASWGSGWSSIRISEDGQHREELSPLDWNHPVLAVSPDSLTLAYLDSGCGGTVGFWLRSLDTRVSRCLAQVKRVAAPVRWRKDGTRVYFLASSLADSVQHLYEVDAIRATVSRVDAGVEPVHSYSFTASGAVMVAKEGRIEQGRTSSRRATEFWLIDRPPPLRAANSAAQPAVFDSAFRSVPLSRVPAALLDVATHAAVSGEQITELWPNFWKKDQSFVLWMPENQATLLVGDGHAFPGFKVVTGDFTFPNFQGRLYLSEGPAIPLTAFAVPITRVSQRVWDSLGPVATREMALRHLFHVAITGSENAGVHPDGRRDPADHDLGNEEKWWGSWGSGPLAGHPVQHDTPRGLCPDGDAASCRALIMLEQRILLAAIDAPNAELPELLKIYAGVRWTRLMASEIHFADFDVARRIGVPRHIASQAALLAAGGDASRYRSRIRNSLRSDIQTGPPFAYAAVHGQALAFLLDRLGNEWRSLVYAGTTLLEAIALKTTVDSTQALTHLVRAMRRFNYGEIIREARATGDTTPFVSDLSRQDFFQPKFFDRVLAELHTQTPPLVITFTSPPRGGPTTGPAIRVAAGPGDSLSLSPGWVVYPAPDSVEIRACGMLLRSSGHPLLIDRYGDWDGYTRNLELRLYLSREIMNQLGEFRPSEAEGGINGLDPWCEEGLTADQRIAAGRRGVAWARRVRGPGFTLDLSNRAAAGRFTGGMSLRP